MLYSGPNTTYGLDLVTSIPPVTYTYSLDLVTSVLWSGLESFSLVYIQTANLSDLHLGLEPLSLAYVQIATSLGLWASFEPLSLVYVYHRFWITNKTYSQRSRIFKRYPLLPRSQQHYRSFVTSWDQDILASNQGCGRKTRDQVEFIVVFSLTSLLQLWSFIASWDIIGYVIDWIQPWLSFLC